MRMIRVNLELPEELVALLNALPGGATDALQVMARHAGDGMCCPGTWEGAWLAQVFPEADWAAALEPDPAVPWRRRPRR